jgi:hypothetical protein
MGYGERLNTRNRGADDSGSSRNLQTSFRSSTSTVSLVYKTIESKFSALMTTISMPQAPFVSMSFGYIRKTSASFLEILSFLLFHRYQHLFDCNDPINYSYNIQQTTNNKQLSISQHQLVLASTTSRTTTHNNFKQQL